MALVPCATPFCPNRVKEGLQNPGVDGRGHELADGRRCWQCRRGRTKHLPGSRLAVDAVPVSPLRAPLKVLDLCSGTGSATAAFRRAGHDVVSVEIRAGFRPSICMDVRFFARDPRGILDSLRPGWRPDFVWASPPCNPFSQLNRVENWRGVEPITEEAREGLEIVAACLQVVQSLDPPAWLLENPVGRLRSMPLMEGLDRWTVTYCAYGAPWMKETDLWGVMPEQWLPLPRCGSRDQCHQGRVVDAPSAVVRSMVPYALGLDVMRCIEAMDAAPTRLSVAPPRSSTAPATGPTAPPRSSTAPDPALAARMSMGAAPAVPGAAPAGEPTAPPAWGTAPMWTPTAPWNRGSVVR